MTITHKALVPLDGPPRPACGGSGRSVARAADVNCPDCLNLETERLARTAESDEFAAADEADTIERSRAEEDRANAVAQADAELHDTHAIPAGGDPLWMNRDPVDEVESHRAYVTEAGTVLIAVRFGPTVTLFDADGNSFDPGHVVPLRPAGMIPHNIAEAIEIDKAMQALTGTRRVADDAIVLPALTAEATRDLETLLDTDLSEAIAAVETEDGRHEVDVIARCPSCEYAHVDSLTPDQADTYAAQFATAAAEARTNAEGINR